ncbi:putative transcription elongation factor SPT5 1 [Capsicum galapagoense]
MARQHDYDDDVDQEEDVYGEDEEEEDEGDRRKRRRSNFIDDDDYGGGSGRRRPRSRTASEFFDLEAVVDSDDDDEEDEEDGDFIVDSGAEIPDEDEDLEELTRSIQKRYARSAHEEYDDEATDVEQQAFLPSVRDPKLWLVKCGIGQERNVAVCLMQKAIDRPELQIRSVVALDHLQNYIYIEADKVGYVREVCMHNIYATNIILVPIKEMTDVLTVESKAVDLARDSWVRMKTGTYKGDLAMVVRVDDMGQRVCVKLIPRIDLQALANKLEGRDVPRNEAVIPRPRLMNIDEAREMNIHVERKRNTWTGDSFDIIGRMSFKDGFLYKTVAVKSISTQNIHPTFNELEKFCQLGEGGNGDIASGSTFFANWKKCRFMKGECVIVIKGELMDMKGRVEKVEEDIVHVRLDHEDLAVGTLAFSERELHKYFEPGNHVKVISGSSEGATGMIGSINGNVVYLVSDTTKETFCVFADDAVESSLVTSGFSCMGKYELHDLVILDNNNFGVIIRVDNEAFQVLKGVPGRPEVALVRLREIMTKIEKKGNAQDHYKNQLAVKDMVKVIEGPCEGKQGSVEYLFRGVVFIHDRFQLEHAGFVCAKAQSCVLIGGVQGDPFSSRIANLRTLSRVPQSALGSSKGGGRDRVSRNLIADNVNASTSFREPFRYGLGSETPSHSSGTPLHSLMTPIRDPGATPIHDGMRTPSLVRAWNPMSPPRDNWEDGNPSSWGGSSSQYQPSTPRSWAYVAPPPGSANSLSFNLPSTPGGQPSMTPSSAYIPGTPGGQPMTPGGGGLDMMSPSRGVDTEGPLLLPAIVVRVRKSNDSNTVIGVIREVLVDGSFRIALGSSGSGETLIAHPREIEIVVPNKSDKIRIMGGSQCGATGKLIGADGTDGIVKVDDTLDVKILDMVVLGKLAHA